MVSHKRKMGFIFILAYMCFLPPAHQAQLPNASVLDLSSKNIDFAMNLYGQISSYHDKNIFFSPLSIFTSFAGLLLASGGNTHEEILKGLNLEQLDRADQPDLIPKLFQLLQEDITQNGSLKVDQGMALFVHKEFSIEKVFEDQIKSFFNADIKSLDFADTKASKTFINDYISNRTEDKVKEMISSVDALTQLMLINTIFFQGDWETQFNPNLTRTEPFFIDNYNVLQVPMMSIEDSFETMEDYELGVKMLKLPYREGVSMLILLPNKGKDYTVIDEEINAATLLGWIKRLHKTKLEVNLPKFKMEQSYSLHNILPDMGFSSIFSSSANLTKLSKEKPLKLSEVLHKAVIEVDETGTTAAAATISGIIPYNLPRTFFVNKPFFFFIYHEVTNALLFMGRVIDPTKN